MSSLEKMSSPNDKKSIKYENSKVEEYWVIAEDESGFGGGSQYPSIDSAIKCAEEFVKSKKWETVYCQFYTETVGFTTVWKNGKWIQR